MNRKTKKWESPIALRIKELRKEKRMSQESLAIKAGIPMVTLAKIEQSAIERPAFQAIWKITIALGCPLDGFINGIDPESTINPDS